MPGHVPVGLSIPSIAKEAMLAKGRIPLNNDNNTYDKYPHSAVRACFTAYGY